MKHLLLAVLLFLSLPGLAQRIGGVATNAIGGQPPVEMPYFCGEAVSRQQRTADSLLQALDKTQIPTHILYDRVAALAALDVFNHVYNNPDTSGVHHFLQAYYELHMADYNNAGTAPCRQLLADNARYHRGRGTILIGVLRYRFNYIDSNAVRNNQLRWDTSAPSRLFDVAGRSGSPYLLREVAVAAALADSSSTGTVNYKLDPASIFTNTGATLSSASIDFGDGNATQTCTPGQTITVNYGTAGQKVIRYVLTYSDGSQFTTYSSLYVPRAAVYSRGRDFVRPCRIESLTAGIAYQNIAGQAQVSYYYSTLPSKICDSDNNTAQPITKPVIIIDGIDYDGIREGGDVYGEYLKYRNGVQVKNLGVELRDEGYDVVILDFPNVYSGVYVAPFTYYHITRHSGADDMERNAYTLVTLIQQLNQRMQAAGSTEQIVVVGPSMGGQIARYALTYMEANSIPHNTRLFISLDSPNNGATVPIGLQHFVKFFADETKDETAVSNLAQLNSPASCELILHHYSQGTSFLPHPGRTNFTTTLANLGNYPSQLRRIAVTNGALDGVRQRDQNGQTIYENQQAFGFEQRGLPNDGSIINSVARILWPVSALARLITVASARVYYEPGYGQTKQVLSAYKFPNGHWQEASGPSGSCGLDGAPGGYRTFFSFATNYRGDLFEKRNYYSVRDKACFIPTLSGLGYTQAADNCMAAGQNLVCAGTTPFDAYYGPVGHNEDHIQLTPANVEFMRNEILKKTPTPVFTTAPNGVCPNGGTAQFSVAAECARAGQPGTTYTWTAGPGLAIVGGQGTATVTVQSAAGYSGTTTLQVVATRTGYAASVPATVPVYVGDGYLVINDGVGPDRCPARGMEFAITNGFGTQGAYTWSVSHGRISSGQGTARIFVSALPFADYQLQVSVSAAGSCAGTTTVAQLYSQHVYPTAPGNIGQCDQSRGTLKATPAAYPNPADDVLTLATPETREAAAPRTAVLYNAQGREVRRTRPGEVQLATADLPTGLYYLMVEQNGGVTRSQIRVQH